MTGSGLRHGPATATRSRRSPRRAPKRDPACAGWRPFPFSSLLRPMPACADVPSTAPRTRGSCLSCNKLAPVRSAIQRGCLAPHERMPGSGGELKTAQATCRLRSASSQVPCPHIVDDPFAWCDNGVSDTVGNGVLGLHVQRARQVLHRSERGAAWNGGTGAGMARQPRAPPYPRPPAAPRGKTARPAPPFPSQPPCRPPPPSRAAHTPHPMSPPTLSSFSMECPVV